MPINSNEAISNHLLFSDCRIWFWFCHSSPSAMVITMLPLIIWQATHIEHAAFLASIVQQCHGVSSHHLKAGDSARGYANAMEPIRWGTRPIISDRTMDGGEATIIP